MYEFIPQWHQQALHELIERRARLPHALLVNGQAGIGKYLFARYVTQLVLCQDDTDNNQPCRQCHACHLFEAGTHPDFYNIELQINDSGTVAKEIKVDQIRQLIGSLSQTSQLGKQKVAVINSAERMNRNAANSLLKTLEEPSGDSLLILVTAHSWRLLPTVRSRCQQIALSPPSWQQAKMWLQGQHPGADADNLLHATNGAPLAAATLFTTDGISQRDDLLAGMYAIAEGKMDPLRVAQKSAEAELPQLVAWITACVQQLISINISGKHEAVGKLDWSVVAKRSELKNLFAFYDKMLQAAQQAHSNINCQMLLESVMLDWSRLFNKTR